MENETVTIPEAYHNLANAIIAQAAKDYINGYRKKEVLEFFKSQWYKELTDVPSEVIIKECNRRIAEKRTNMYHSYRKGSR